MGMTAANSETCGNWERTWSITGDQDELRATVEAIHAQINACGWDETASFAVRLAMDEALSNALQHGNGGDAAQAIELVVKVDVETVSLTVTDQGQGFDLDVQARSDTGRWLEVTGAVRMHAGMVLISADQIALADPPTAPERRVVSQAPRIGLPPEVIFSAPLVDDTDVPSDTTVRIQFSRDMDSDSFQNRIKVSYSDPQRTNQSIPNTGEMRFDIAYRARNRVLEITFQEELTRFQTLRVDLLKGITATDGASLEPWALSFFVGR